MDHPENIVTELIQEEHRSKWIALRNHNVKCFTEDEIKIFTNNYETILGRGAFGDVYKGVLQDKSMVAVKKFISSTHDACVSEHGLITLGVDKLVSQEADVYSFGVLLLEVLTRKTPVESTQHEEGVDLPQWARSVIREAREEWSVELFDVELRRLWQNDRKKQHMIRLLQLALKCCSQDTNSRPTMSNVVQRIEEIR